MTPADLLRIGACGPRCLLASTAPTRCACPCDGVHHGALLHVDITGLIEARRNGYHRLTDTEIVGGAA